MSKRVVNGAKLPLDAGTVRVLPEGGVTSDLPGTANSGALRAAGGDELVWKAQIAPEDGRGDEQGCE